LDEFEIFLSKKKIEVRIARCVAADGSMDLDIRL
jgi:hypothetical protein